MFQLRKLCLRIQVDSIIWFSVKTNKTVELDSASVDESVSGHLVSANGSTGEETQQAAKEEQGGELSCRHYRFSDMKEEWLNEKLSRRLVVGKNEMLGYVILKKGCYVPAHKHVSEQITIILKGALEFDTQGKKIVVSEGETLVIPPWVEHAAVALEDTVDIDCFSPLREDWLSGNDEYLRRSGTAPK
jgi:quercetin dioxygenase-like cupin family protein